MFNHLSILLELGLNCFHCKCFYVFLPSLTPSTTITHEQQNLGPTAEVRNVKSFLMTCLDELSQICILKKKKKKKQQHHVHEPPPIVAYFVIYHEWRCRQQTAWKVCVSVSTHLYISTSQRWTHICKHTVHDVQSNRLFLFLSREYRCFFIW